MTFAMLIAKMQAELNNGAVAVFESWLNEINSKMKFDYTARERISFQVRGFLWGLRATGFLNSSDYDFLFEELQVLTYGEVDKEL